MDEYEQLQRLTAHLRIAHHIPGRIRLKLATDPDADLRDAAAQAKRFHGALDEIPGIRAVSLNLLARSCTVEYDSTAIPAAAWPDLLNGVRSPAADSLFQLLVSKYRQLAAA